MRRTEKRNLLSCNGIEISELVTLDPSFSFIVFLFFILSILTIKFDRELIDQGKNGFMAARRWVLRGTSRIDRSLGGINGGYGSPRSSRSPCAPHESSALGAPAFDPRSRCRGPILRPKRRDDVLLAGLRRQWFPESLAIRWVFISNSTYKYTDKRKLA